MGTLYVDTLEPEGATTTLTVGETGQNTVVGGNTLKLNTLKDAGGNTIFVSDGSGNLSSVNSGLGGSMVLISSQAVTNQAAVSFTSGISSTYSHYVFKFYNVNPATDDVSFSFQCSTDGGTSYGLTITSTFWNAYNSEAGSGAISYETAWDLAQSTSYQNIAHGQGNDADQGVNGELYIFSLSSTTYMKQFFGRASGHYYGSYAQDLFPAGYLNLTTAIDAVQFKFSSGNFDGTIKMFGMK